MIEAPVTISARAVPRTTPATMSGNMTGLYSMTGDMVASTGDSFLDSREGDEEALEALYTATNGASWDTNTGWAASGMSLSDSIYGVDVDTVGGELRVVRIKLNGSGFGSDGVVGGNGLTGTLPNAIGNLKECWYFNVKSNQISGTLKGDAFASMNPIYLLLNGVTKEMAPDESYHPGKETNGFLSEYRTNTFTGTIGSWIGQCTNLEWFEISGRGNEASPCLTGDVHESISNCPLKGFQISWNKITSIPASLGQCTDMIHIGFENQWENLDDLNDGDLDFLTTMTLLRSIFMEDNAYRIDFPDLSDILDLRQLLFKMGRFTGPFPQYLTNGNWSNINMIEADFNNMSGSIGEVSEDNNLASYSAAFSPNMTGIIPDSYWLNTNLIGNNFENSPYSGTVPEDLTHMSRPRTIRLNDTNLSGNIPKMDWLTPSKFDGTSSARFADSSFDTDSYDIVEDGRESSDSGPIVQKTRKQWYEHFFDSTSF